MNAWRLWQVKWLMRRCMAHADRGEWAAAETVALKALAITARSRIEDAPVALECRVAAAYMTFAQHRPGEAVDLLRGSPVLMAKDSSGPYTAWAQMVLAAALLKGGQCAEAADAARAALTADPGAADYGDLCAQDLLGRSLGELGEHRRAVEVLAEVAATSSDVVMVFRARSNRLQHLVYLGCHEEAAVEAAAIKAEVAAVGGAHSEFVSLATDTALGFDLCAQDRFAEAEQLLRPAAAEAYRLGHGTFARTLQMNLGRALVGQGRAEEAWETLVALENGGPDGRVSSRAASALALGRAAALLALARANDAEGEARAAIDLCSRHLGPQHHRQLEARTILGAALARQGKHSEAIDLLTDAHQTWIVHFGEHHHGTRRAQLALAEAQRT